MCNININSVLIGLTEIKKNCDAINAQSHRILTNCKSVVMSQINDIDKALAEVSAGSCNAGISTEINYVAPRKKYTRKKKQVRPAPASFDGVADVVVSGEEVEQLQVGAVFTVDGQMVVVDKSKDASPRPGWRIRTLNGRVYERVISKDKVKVTKWLKSRGGKYTNSVIKLKRRGATRTRGVVVTTSVNY